MSMTVDTTVNTTVDTERRVCAGHAVDTTDTVGREHYLEHCCRTLTGLEAAHRGQDGGLRRAYSCRRSQACEAGRAVWATD